MRKILFQIADIKVPSYPAMLYSGILLGMYAQFYAATTIGLNATRTVIATLILLIPALIGARLLYVVSQFRTERSLSLAYLRVSSGGGSMYGGVLASLPVSVPLLALLQIPFGSFWDVASFTMLVGSIFARFGCILNGCCSGLPTKRWFGVNLPDHFGSWKRRIPTQLLEAFWSVALLIGACRLWQHRPFQGALFVYSVGSYSVGRFFLEFARQEKSTLYGIALNHVVSAWVAIISALVFVLHSVN